MDKLENMRIFVTVAESQGFAAAARRLGTSAPAVTRAVAALEQAIGARLLHRTTRIVRLSEAGRRFLDDAKRILAEVGEAEASAAGTHKGVSGHLLVTASVLFGRLHVAPIMLDFLSKQRAIMGQLLLVDRYIDLMAEGFDVAVRIAELPDSSLSAVRVGVVRQVTCAAPSYLRNRSKIRVPSDLEKHDCFAFHGEHGNSSWRFAGQTPVVVNPRYRLLVNSAQVAIDAAVDGHGVTRALSYMVAEHVQRGALAIVLDEFEPPPIPVHILFVEGRGGPARVRAFIDFAAPRLRRVFAAPPGVPVERSSRARRR